MLSKLKLNDPFLQHLFRLCLNILIAFVMFSHGTQKLFGWFGGMGIQKTADAFAALGLTPAQPMVILAGVFEILFALGMLLPKTRVLSGLGIIFFMVFAGIQSYEGKWFLFGGYGWEFALLFILAILVTITLPFNEKKIKFMGNTDLVRKV